MESKYIEDIKVINEVVSKSVLESELNKFNLALRYNHARKEYYIHRKGNILERLYKNLEMNTPFEIVEEFLRMEKSFREQEYIIENIIPKKALDMCLEEFIKAYKYGHKEVDDIMNKYFKNIDVKEKRRIRNEYDDVREYVYCKYINDNLNAI